MLLLICLLSVAAGATLPSCYKESVRRRHFSINPGNYNPEATTTTSCRSSCGLFSFQYAALTSGKFCYCSNQLPPDTELATNPASCNIPCPGDPSEMCGGTKFASVYSSIEKITGLVLHSNVEGQLINVGTAVTLQVSISSGIGINYRVDYDDGSAISNTNTSDMLNVVYNSPGLYSIMVYANDDKRSLQDQVAATGVRVEALPKQVEVKCLSVFATFEEGNCTGIVWWGTSMILDIKVSTFSFSFSIEDPPLSLAGPALNDKTSQAGDITSALYLLHASEFSVSGKIIRWEMLTDQSMFGSLTVLLLKPECGSDNYCYSSNACTQTAVCDSTTAKVSSCLTGEQFCVQSAVCQPSIRATVYRYSTLAPKYKVVQVITLKPPSSTGNQFWEETNTYQVEPGYILGLQQDGSQTSLKRFQCSADDCDVQLAYTNSPAGSILESTSGTRLKIRHALRAVASAGSKVFLPFTFEKFGNFTLDVVAKSTSMTGSPTSQGSTTVVVLEGVNASVISGPLFGITGEPVKFNVLPHTGNSIFYTWRFSDGSEFTGTIDQTKAYTFANKGNYTVNVTTYNAVSSKSNVTTIIIEDRVSGLSVSVTPTVVGVVTNINLTLRTGSNYKCMWNFGDNSQQGPVDEKDAPLSGSSRPYTYSTAGSYNVTVTCTNDVSSSSGVATIQVRETISNLHMVTLGAEKNKLFYLEWAVDSGTDISFVVTLDGKSFTDYSIINKYTWRSGMRPALPTGTILVSILATNKISNASLIHNFSIVTGIKDPTLTSSTVNTTNNQDVTFTVNMKEGSEVTVINTYGDGQTDKFVQPAGATWLEPIIFKHAFKDGGLYTVVSIISNAAGSHTKSLKLMVYVGIEAINCSLEDYSLYYPPAVVNFYIHARAKPTEATLTLSWGERLHQNINPALMLDKPYEHTYRDTGRYTVMANVSNHLGYTSCVKEVEVVERLLYASFDQKFKSAAFNQPFSVTFCLFRGPSQRLCNLTYNFGDGKPAQVFQRQGAGKNGCDTRNVTYTDFKPKNITVTATSPMESISASLLTSIIQGLTKDDIVVTTDGDVQLKNLTILNLIYVGPTLPTNANVTVIFGDGSKDDHTPLTVKRQNEIQKFFHIYSKDGIFDARVIVFNDAVSVEAGVKVGVYQPFLNVKLKLYYLADIPPNSETLGLDGSSSLFPLNKPIYFSVMDDNNAFATSINITIIGSDGHTIFEGRFLSKTFSVQLNKIDNFVAHISISNPLYMFNITSKTFTVIELVEGLMLTEEQFKVKVNEHKIIFMNFTKVGTKTCVYIDFGDGFRSVYSDVLSTCTKTNFMAVNTERKPLLDGRIKLDHVYTSEGFFNVTAIAENSYSSETRTVGFSITSLDCTKPVVYINNGHDSFLDPAIYKRSERIPIQGQSSVSCSVSYDNHKFWFVERINATDNTVIANVNLDKLDTTRAQLIFLPRFLEIGLYKVHYTMTMIGSYNRNKFESSTYTYVRVIPSDLIAILIDGGASHVFRGSSQTLELNPLKYSLDPDVDPMSTQGLVVKNWTCELLNNASETCISGGFNPPSPTQSITVGTLQNGTYIFSVVLQKDTRYAVARLKMTTVQGTSPILKLSPVTGYVYYQQSYGYKIPKTRFALTCNCISCSSAAHPVYLWLLKIPDYRWKDGYRPLLQDEFNGLVTGINSQQVSLDPGLFDLFNVLETVVECTVDVSGETGRVSVNLQINSPPVPGSCLVTPFNRTITSEKAWSVAVQGWSDSDGIAGYQLSIHTDSSTLDKQVTFVDTDSASFDISVCLSEGPSSKNYKQTIILTVRDVLGGMTTFACGDVVVRPVEAKQIREMTESIKNNPLHELQRVFAEGDPTTCTQRATNIVSLLNSDSKQSQTEYSGLDVASNFVNTMYGTEEQNRPSFMLKDDFPDIYMEHKMESERDSRAKVRSELVKNMLQLSFTTVVSIQQFLCFLEEVTRYGDEIVQETQLDVAAAVEKMITSLSNPEIIKNVPQEDVEAAMKYALATLGCLMDAAGKNGFHGTRSELEDATKDAQFFDYDTSIKFIGANDDLSSANSFEEAQKIHTAQVHKKRQAKTSEIIRSKVTAMLDKIAGVFAATSVPDQVMETSTPKLKQIMIKSYPESLKGAQLCVPDCDGGVILPNSSIFKSLDNSQPVVVSVSQTTSFSDLYSDKASEISPTSNFITIDLYTVDGKKLTVQDLPEPLEVKIPIDKNAQTENYEVIDPKISQWSNLMNFVVYLTTPHCSIHMDFGDMPNRQILVVVKLGKLASIAANSSNDDCDYVMRIPEYVNKNLDDKDRYRLFISSDLIKNHTGIVSIGLRELRSSEYDLNLSKGCSSLPRYPNGSDYFKGTFKLMMYSSKCMSNSDAQNKWTNDGCKVNKKTNCSVTVCDCTHLTTFAGGWVVVPNTIDWNYVFSNADFLTNPTIYITVIVIAILYVIAAVMARYKDKKMVEQLGLTPLADNDPRDKYFYELIVCTGMRRNAGTESQVCFILSGEDDETDVRVFSDNKRKIFRRGQIDSFLMAVERPLGYLNFMRVWHDNSGRGKFGSWYLNYIMVRDIQTDTKQLFIANKWFAVEEDDGQVDRVIPVANHEQLSDFSFQFGERSRKNFADGHLWYSVIARPPQSRFTCLQRVSCCLCLLYVTMLANAMFYNTTSQQESASNSFSFGPFSIAPEQIFIGVVSNLIVFPFNFLLVYLFNKSRPHHKRPSRIDLAMKEVHEQSKQANINDIKPEVSSIFSVAKSPCLPRSAYDSEMPSSRPGTAISNTSSQELTPRKKKSRCELPWYFTFIAWILLWLVTLASMALVIFYGISFKDETCRKWITSMLVSFFMSVFVTQPIKVVLFAIILSLIIKNPGEEKEDEAEDEELPTIDQEKELLHGDSCAVEMTRPRKIGYKPPDPELLEKLREKRLKEIKMWEIIREVTVYSFFLWILMVISYRQMGASNFLYKDTLYKVFIANKDTKIDFFAIRNTDEFWTWATSGLVNGIRAGPYYNDYPPLKLRTYINDKVSRIMGYATMRQLRVRPGLCEVPVQIHQIIQKCNVAYNMFDQEERSFAPGWQLVEDLNAPNDTVGQYYKYTKANELNGYPYWGTLGWYSGGGYVVPLNGSKKDLIEQMEQLQREKWLDKFTRAVFVEFTVYNPQVNLFAISTILAEFHASGGLVQSVRIEPAMLLPYMTSAMLFQIVCEVVYVMFSLFFIIRELKELFKSKLNYFRYFWNLVEVGIITMSVSAIIIFFYKLITTNSLTKSFKDTKGNGYIKFQYVAYWNETFSYMIGFLCFLATLKFLKLLRFNRKMSMLSATLKFSASSLLHFAIIFSIVFLAFAQLFYLTYMHINVDYSTFVSSMMAGVLMMMGKFDILSMIMAEPVLTQIFVLLFVLTVTFILVNMFVTILNETFTAVREDINKQGNDYEIVNFMLLRFKQWTGFDSTEESLTSTPKDLNNILLAGEKKTDHIGDFPDRIERLLQTISSVYMDNDNLAELYKKKPYESQPANKNVMKISLSPTPGQVYNQKRKNSSDIMARVHTH